MEFIALLTVSMLVIVPIVLPFLVLGTISFVLEGIAFTRLQRKKPVRYWWLVWVPYLDVIGKMHLLADLSEKTDIHMFCGRMVFKKKITPWKIYFTAYIGSTLISMLGLTIIWVPIIGTVNIGLDSLIMLVAGVWLKITEYAYLRDLLETHRPNNPSNVSTAVWVTIGNIFTCSLVRAIFLYKLAKIEINAGE